MTTYRISTAQRYLLEHENALYKVTIQNDRVINCERAFKVDADRVGDFETIDFEDVPFLVHVKVTNHIHGDTQLEAI